MERIRYKQSVPSWSWTAYIGYIEYMHFPYKAVEWNETVQFAKEGVLEAPVRVPRLQDQTEWNRMRRMG